MDELFPDLELIPKKVATSKTVGGKCAHCSRGLKRGKEVHKLAPACCQAHRLPHVPGSVNGPGRWVCTTCLHRLT